MNKILLFIVVLIFSFGKIQMSQNCIVKKKIFDDSRVDCDNTGNLQTSINQLVDNLNNAFANPNDDCIPKDLRNILKDRLCSGIEIRIFCRKKKEEFTKKKKAFWNPCKKRWDYKYIYKERERAAAGSDEIQLNPDLLEKDPDTIEMTLYHELIHVAENYYGEQKYNAKDISEEDFTYTCTKKYYNSGKCTSKAYPGYKDCPLIASKCIPCEQYSPPQKPATKK